MSNHLTRITPSRALGLLSLAAAVPLAAVAIGMTQNSTDSGEDVFAELMRRVSHLEAECTDLHARVAMLEAAQRTGGGGGGGGGATGGAAAGSASAPAGSMLIMKFYSLQTPPQDPNLMTQAQQLRSDAAQIDQQVAQLRIQIGQLLDNSVGQGDDSTRMESSGQRGALQAQVDQLCDQATRKRAQASTMERQYKYPPRVVRGWDGQRVVTLPVDGANSDVVDGLNPGDFITWRGVRSQLNGNVEVYSKIFTLQKVPAPANFRDPPGGQLPD